jgi:signal transduction histidine kinase
LSRVALLLWCTLQEVSTAGTRLLLDAMERHSIPPAPLLSGLPVSEGELRAPGQRVDWDIWVELVERLQTNLGGPAELERFTLLATAEPGQHQFQRVAQLLSSPLALYRLNSRWGVPNQYRHMLSTCEELGSGQLRIVNSIPERYRGSLAAFRAAAGVLRGLPQVVGLPEAKVVSQQVLPHRVEVTLVPPGSRTLLARIRQATRHLSGLRSMLDQLDAQERELDDKHRALELQLLEQKRIEGELRASEERWRALAQAAEERDAELGRAQRMSALGRLAGGVAHDFNNLLTVILGGTHLLESTRLDKEQAEEVAEIRRASERAVHLTRQLLTFSRQQATAPELLRAEAVLEQSRGLLQRLCGPNVALELQAAAGLWPVKIDRGQLEQVLMNLAVNARDAMPQGGLLTISLRNLEHAGGALGESALVPPGQYLELAVRDTGIGMSLATASQIFEPFFTTKPLGHGTGLGLAILHGIVTQNGGHVRVESAAGRGSTFFVLLPRAAAYE